MATEQTTHLAPTPIAGRAPPLVGPAPPLEPVFSSISCAVVGAAQQRYTRAWYPPERQPGCYTMLLCTEGSASIVVDEQTASLASGVLLLLPPQASLVRRPPLHAFTAFAVDFTARLHGLLDVPAVCGLPITLRPGAFRWPKLLESAGAIVNHVTNRMPGYELAVHTHCVRLLDLTWKEALAQRGVRGDQGDQGVSESMLASAAGWLLPVCKAIEANPAARFTVADLAQIAHFHPAYLSTLFKKATGVSPLRYVTQCRLQRARDLLRLTDRTLGDIAVLTGFYDAAHLTRAFRRAEGVPPGRYRKSNEHPTFR